ncbi:hypothetical protein DICPUDRAFT_99161 [Dictyostelium purpureum]|uniref:Uncharacterized protein n=1 Tax=Dictyostelium purpureum TaxID=5786 RepID=F0ZWR8_DICPU|nr:uncharacterized protein DICPUDRAFT_99161 [Dictyostelium purpureum]EGC31610.1 hypothetical protein DICPUDRAFT_99161 [Dictyostelium purpureum]|eukprot:XP_003291868.1 hypothetical protein DICPUDRAFT_99161 [Dictyostelium purpureum]
MDFGTILIQNPPSVATSKKKRSSAKNIDLQDVDSHIRNNNKSETKTTTSNSSNNSEKKKKKVEGKEEPVFFYKITSIVKEMKKKFENEENKNFNILDLSNQLNLCLSKCEQVIEVLTILKVIRIVGSYYFEWVGVNQNREFERLLNEVFFSEHNYVTGEKESILCENCMRYSSQTQDIKKDYSRYDIYNVTLQVLKLLLNAKKKNLPLALDTLCFNMYKCVPSNDKSTFNILKGSRYIKLSGVVLKVLKALGLVKYIDIYKNVDVYLWEGVTNTCCY